MLLTLTAFSSGIHSKRNADTPVASGFLDSPATAASEPSADLKGAQTLPASGSVGWTGWGLEMFVELTLPTLPLFCPCFKVLCPGHHTLHFFLCQVQRVPFGVRFPSCFHLFFLGLRLFCFRSPGHWSGRCPRIFEDVAFDVGKAFTWRLNDDLAIHNRLGVGGKEHAVNGLSIVVGLISPSQKPRLPKLEFHKHS